MAWGWDSGCFIRGLHLFWVGWNCSDHLSARFPAVIRGFLLYGYGTTRRAFTSIQFRQEISFKTNEEEIQ